jgi:hypothetical protein
VLFLPFNGLIDQRNRSNDTNPTTSTTAATGASSSSSIITILPFGSNNYNNSNTNGDNGNNGNNGDNGSSSNASTSSLRVGPPVATSSTVGPFDVSDSKSPLSPPIPSLANITPVHPVPFSFNKLATLTTPSNVTSTTSSISLPTTNAGTFGAAMAPLTTLTPSTSLASHLLPLSVNQLYNSPQPPMFGSSTMAATSVTPSQSSMTTSLFGSSLLTPLSSSSIQPQHQHSVASSPSWLVPPVTSSLSSTSSSPATTSNKGGKKYVEYKRPARVLPESKTQKRGGAPVDREHQQVRPAKRFKTTRAYAPVPVGTYTFSRRSNVIIGDTPSALASHHAPVSESLKALKARVQARSAMASMNTSPVIANRRSTDFFGGAPLAHVARELGQLHLERKAAKSGVTAMPTSPTHHTTFLSSHQQTISPLGLRSKPALSPAPIPSWRRTPSTNASHLSSTSVFGSNSGHVLLPGASVTTTTNMTPSSSSADDSKLERLSSSSSLSRTSSDGIHDLTMTTEDGTGFQPRFPPPRSASFIWKPSPSPLRFDTTTTGSWASSRAISPPSSPPPASSSLSPSLLRGGHHLLQPQNGHEQQPPTSMVSFANSMAHGATGSSLAFSNADTNGNGNGNNSGNNNHSNNNSNGNGLFATPSLPFGPSTSLSATNKLSFNF